MQLESTLDLPEMRQSGRRDDAEVNNGFSLSIFTIEIDGKPTIAFEAKKYSEAEAICHDEGLRARLRVLKSGEVPICGDNAILDVRLAKPDEAARYRQAADASKATKDFIIVFMIELDRE